MGTDIHFAVEVKRDGRWRRVLPPKPLDQWLIDQAAKEEPPGHYAKRAAVTWFDDRNYDVFGMLADVRNGHAFAGCDTGDGFEPISKPRGLPDDVSDEVRQLSGDTDDGDIWLGCHDFSWLLLSELLAYSWDAKTKHRGWVDAEAYKVFLAKGKPSSWCGGISGRNAKHVSQERMQQLIDAGADAKHAYTQVEWSERYSESAGRFYSVVLPALKALAESEGVTYEEVRAVFGFDS